MRQGVALNHTDKQVRAVFSLTSAGSILVVNDRTVLQQNSSLPPGHWQIKLFAAEIEVEKRTDLHVAFCPQRANPAFELIN